MKLTKFQKLEKNMKYYQFAVWENDKSIKEIIFKAFNRKEKDLADTFATEFLQNVNNNTKSTIPTRPDDVGTYSNDCDMSLRIDKTLNDKIINNFNINKIPGNDAIRVSDLKYISQEISPVITHLIISSLKTCRYLS